jgi:hypothetical protein
VESQLLFTGRTSASIPVAKLRVLAHPNMYFLLHRVGLVGKQGRKPPSSCPLQKDGSMSLLPGYCIESNVGALGWVTPSSAILIRRDPYPEVSSLTPRPPKQVTMGTWHLSITGTRGAAWNRMHDCKSLNRLRIPDPSHLVTSQRGLNDAAQRRRFGRHV